MSTDRRSFLAVGHRGDPYRFRENSLPSIRSALSLGADAVEVDVRLTRDGVPVLLHDETLERLWGHERWLADLTKAELDALTGGEVPTLREAVLAVGARRLLIDLPGAHEPLVREVVEVLHVAGAGQRMYYCGGPAAMMRVRAADPHAEIALTWKSTAPPRPELLAAIGPRWLNCRFALVDRALVERAHRSGLLVGAWTADTRRTMRRLLAAGVDAITTNRLRALTGEVAEFRRTQGS
ncbi:glycerophosphodiester phosphodiesterase [Streptomyces candidus]|uniref:Glycerophosphoryl diester phosphodiesterase n=1 Tax=Streptomyces candidus TaxID=67283 RepID=A0A7X0LRS2_9ACTN|nr:glycerophosphodiester phosphodiesterase [Streptomyces candidus]MBB6438387.1 glycerophosphoryl diester phosphodiesterase [Streptomyces candidus]GHH52243.1 glycerophosphoryl diester phosphodiesterase [Streptomyces candidus]